MRCQSTSVPVRSTESRGPIPEIESPSLCLPLLTLFVIDCLPQTYRHPSHTVRNNASVSMKISFPRSIGSLVAHRMNAAGGVLPPVPRNLNRFVFNVSPGMDFILKKTSPNYRYKKCTRRGFVWYKKLVPGTKVLFVGFVTHGMLESRKFERCSFCLPCGCRTWDQENEIFTGKTHLLNQQEGRERVGGIELLLWRGGCGSSKEGMTL